jgi:hypothetical protein
VDISQIRPKFIVPEVERFARGASFAEATRIEGCRLRLNEK